MSQNPSFSYQEVESDYGSDFEPDDLLLIDRYLTQAQSEFLSPSLAIADPDDEPGHGHFAYVPHRRETNNQEAGQDKEVFTQRGYESNGQSVSGLVSATLSGPPSFGPTHPPSSAYSEFGDEALETWDVWKDTLPASSDTVRNEPNPEQPIITSKQSRDIGVSMKDALKAPPPSAPQESSQGVTPLTRFRSPPKKPLSVTDLVSPAWCELQYYFTLSRYGKVRPTVAMRKGSEVHAKLEEEVFTRVRVPVQSKEDSWALQLWNVINSLRTLRDTGMTREMQVWGVIDGQVVAGVIDELRVFSVYDEEALRKEAELDRSVVNEALMVDGTKALGAIPNRQDDQRLVFLTDVKTRSSKSIPRGSGLRGTIYQLMLYHTLVQDLISHKTDFNIIFERYRLDPQKPFTETFLNQMYELEVPSSTNHESMTSSREGQDDPNSQNSSQPQRSTIPTPSSSFLSRMASLTNGTPAPSISAPSETKIAMSSQLSSISSLSPSQSQVQSSETHVNNNLTQDQRPHSNEPYTPIPLLPSSLFHRHNTLASLLTLLDREITLTFPYGSATLSPYLQACYRDKNTSEITGHRTFMHDAEVLQRYIKSELDWWTGEREAKGVSPEEGFKCGMCEFASGCGWRAGLMEQDETRRREKGFNKSGWTTRVTGIAAGASTALATATASGSGGGQQRDFSTGARMSIQFDTDVECERATITSSSSKGGVVPGAWISDTGSEALKPADGIALGGRKGAERSRSII